MLLRKIRLMNRVSRAGCPVPLMLSFRINQLLVKTAVRFSIMAAMPSF